MCMHNARHRLLSLTILALVGALANAASYAEEAALTDESPEVLKAIDRGVKYLESNGASDSRLGACALAGTSLLTYGKSIHHPMIDHPMVAKCAANIQEALGDHDIEEFGKTTKFDMYSTGMSIIFLVDRAPGKHRADIECLLRYLRKMQKPHGGWGYSNLETGDTSMTQYGVLSLWKAKHAKFNVPIESIERVTLWLMRTQDPSGAYGYQGKIGENNKLIKQSGVKQSLAAAGLGSLYICSDMLGMTKKVERRDDNVPRALKEVKPKENKPGAPKVKTSIDSQLVHAAEGRGNQWFAKNFTVDQGQYNYYYFYAFERYMSLRGRCEKIDKNPKWYSDIAAHLLEKQAEDGSWKGGCGVVSDTSFAVLFLLRSMERTLTPIQKLGGGLMSGNRGFPENTKGAMLNAEGKVVDPKLIASAERLFTDIEKNPSLEKIDELAGLIKDLPSDKLAEMMKKHGDVMRRLVSNRSPEARLAIVQALGKSRNLDNVEVLLYALTDPAPKVVRAANKSLNRIRRAPDAFALPEGFTEEERRAAINKWKAWYRSIRPDAKLEWTE